jgi:hypothetical protein
MWNIMKQGTTSPGIKSLAGTLMAMARLNLPSVFVYWRNHNARKLEW